MSGFDPVRAVRQDFVDCIVSALGRTDGSGSPYGWHLTDLAPASWGEGVVTLAFETPKPLQGWDGGEKVYAGPRRVCVHVQVVSPDVTD